MKPELTIKGEVFISLSEGEVVSVGSNNLRSISRIAELQDDFIITLGDGNFKLERLDSNLYDSSSSVVFVSILEDASLSVDYIGQDEVVIEDISDKVIEDAYSLLSIVNDAIRTPKECVRVFLIHNYNDLFKDEVLKGKFLDYVEENKIFVAAD